MEKDTLTVLIVGIDRPRTFILDMFIWIHDLINKDNTRLSFISINSKLIFLLKKPFIITYLFIQMDMTREKKYLLSFIISNSVLNSKGQKRECFEYIYHSINICHQCRFLSILIRRLSYVYITQVLYIFGESNRREKYRLKKEN